MAAVGYRGRCHAGCGLRRDLLGIQLRVHADLFGIRRDSAGFASIVHAVWYFSGTLAVLILRKPGAALYVNLIGTLVETVIGSQFDLGFVIISALLQGVFAEIPFALTRYRMFNLPISIASGALVALEYGTYLMLFRYVGVSFVSPRGIVHMISEVTGGVLISGVMAWYLMLAIAKTGVLDRLASGRALIERRA